VDRGGVSVGFWCWLRLALAGEEGGVVWNEPGGVSTLKVNGIRLIMLG
jgi:hypothetical protein